MDSFTNSQAFWYDIIKPYLNVGDLIILRFTSKFFVFLQPIINEQSIHYPHSRNRNWASFLSFFGYYNAFNHIHRETFLKLLDISQYKFDRTKNDPYSDNDRIVIQELVMRSFRKNVNLEFGIKSQFFGSGKVDGSGVSILHNVKLYKVNWQLYYTTDDIISYVLKSRKLEQTEMFTIIKTSIKLLLYRGCYDQVKSILSHFQDFKSALRTHLKRIFVGEDYDMIKVFEFFETLRNDDIIEPGYIGYRRFRAYLLDSEYFEYFYSLTVWPFLLANKPFGLRQFDFVDYYTRKYPNDYKLELNQKAFEEWKQFPINKAFPNNIIVATIPNEAHIKHITSYINKFEVNFDDLYYILDVGIKQCSNEMISLCWRKLLQLETLTIENILSLKKFDRKFTWDRFFQILFSGNGNIDHSKNLQKNISIIIKGYMEVEGVSCLCSKFIKHDNLHICELFNPIIKV